MLAGVGGRTVAEAKERLCYAEFLSWVAYRNKRGSLNVGLRVEYGSAQLATILANIHSKNGGYKLYDFAPHLQEPALSLDQAMSNWQ